MILIIGQDCILLYCPSSLGLEASGIIKEIGPNVSNFSIGDKVAYSAVPLGAYSTHRIYKSKNLVKVPEEIDLALAATLMDKRFNNILFTT